jgi:predicted glycosyltransferase
MRILIDITHPAHVHFLRNAREELQKRGHVVAVTAREKDVALKLLDNYKIPYTTLSKKSDSKFALIGEMIIRDVRLWNFCRKFKPDILTGISAIFAAHVGWLLRKPVVVWDDTETATSAHRITYPFVTAVYSPDCYLKTFGKKHHLYPGCHELAYLHPNRFTPDIEVVKSVGINPEERYCIIRFVSWQAHHDIGQHGFDNSQKLSFMKEISKYARPYITSEAELPEELKPYQLKIPIHEIHHVMAFASLYVGEGVTMASESAVLGVPAVYVNTMKIGYIDMHARYGLLKKTTDTHQALQYCLDLLGDPETKDKCRMAREKLLADKIDVTDYIVDTIEKTALNHRKDS